MKNNLPIFIALRYVFTRQEQGFISFVSLVSWLGLILGVAAMIVVLSVMNGFDRELRQRILRVMPHGFVSWESTTTLQDWRVLARELEQQPGIESVAPLISGKALVAFGDETVAVELNGVLPEQENAISQLQDSLLIGSLEDLKADEYGIILGQQLARRLKVSVGDSVRVMLPDVQVTAAGIFPRQKKFTVVGVFRVGADPDEHLAMTHLYTAAKLFRRWEANKEPLVERLRLKTTDIHRADRILAAVREKFTDKDIAVSSWEDDHRILFNAIRMERRVISLLLFAVIAVAVFNIASILVMMVAEKRKDIAILRVMGADAGKIMYIFLWQGLLIGILGILMGVLAGSVLAWSIEPIMAGLEALLSNSLFNADVYYIAHLPSDYRPGDVAVIAIVALVLCLLAALYPAWQASRIDPVHSLNE